MADVFTAANRKQAATAIEINPLNIDDPPDISITAII
jgi:hypothetical protein